jgi:hypothetical protein
MGIRECLVSAAEQGAISRAEAQALLEMYEEQFAQTRLAMGDAPARAKARTDLEARLRGEAAERRRLADLTEAKRLTLLERKAKLPDDPMSWGTGALSAYGTAFASSMRGVTEAIIGTSHARMADAMFAFRRQGLLGRRANRALHTDLVKELKGEASGNATAKHLARAISGVLEDLRQRFNAAGGAIGKLAGWGLPQSHDPAKVRALGRDGWKAKIRPQLDPARMTDSLTGQPISPARLDAALDKAYDNIVSGGMANLEPQTRPYGLGALANRHADERFFVFRDAESWLAYHRDLGKGDVVQTIFTHVNAMARDIAAMETLGPNPQAMVEWMKQVVLRDFGRAEAAGGGVPGLAQVEGKFASAYVGWLYQMLRGQQVVVHDTPGFAAAFRQMWRDPVKGARMLGYAAIDPAVFGNVANITSSAILGGVGVLAGVTDSFIARAARRVAGLPQTSQNMGMLRMLKQQNRDEIVRSGVIWGEYMHVMADQIRFGGQMMGTEWTRWIVDRAMTWNGLKPLTTGRQLLEARQWQAHVADLAKAGTGFDALDPRFRRALDGFGVTREHWDIWTQGVDAQGFVTPMEIMRRGGDVAYIDRPTVPMTDPARIAEEKALRHRAAAEKLAEVISSWNEHSIPTLRPNQRAAMTGGLARGTVFGELAAYFGQLKSFPLSFTASQLEQLAMVGGLGSRSGMAHLARLVVPMTIGGGLYIQFRTMADGKDPEDMTEWSFWARALAQGGGFGLFGDFVKASENRFGQSALEATAGPGLAFISDAMQLARGYADAALGAEGANPGRDTRRFMQRWTPVLSSHPATRAAWNRLVLDHLQQATDPKAQRSFRAQISRAKQQGSPHFLPPGMMTRSAPPERPRLPRLESAIGR